MKQKSINERIAMEVMGWKLENLPIKGFAKTIDHVSAWTKDGNYQCNDLPNWSGDLTLAMGLLEGFAFEIESFFPGSKFSCRISGRWNSVSLMGNSFGSTIPEAVCLAVLDWHEKNPRSPTKSQSKGTIVGSAKRKGNDPILEKVKRQCIK